jgi:hypothetical protein
MRTPPASPLDEGAAPAGYRAKARRAWAGCSQREGQHGHSERRGGHVSSDNYYLIRRAGGRYGVSMEFASDDLGDDRGPVAAAIQPVRATRAVDDPHVRWFDDLDDARAFAHGEYSEYGVTEDIKSDWTGDTRAARLARAAAQLLEIDEGMYDWDLLESHHNANEVVVWMGDMKVTVQAPTMQQAHDFTDWLWVTSPGALARTEADKTAAAARG